jgi:3-oxoadipate enol-lactonase
VPHAEVNGQRLYYELEGDGEPVLLVMGLGADHLSWTPQVRPLAGRFQVASFDNRDVGQSSYATEPYEITDMAADALALADSLGFDRFHLVGVSMGGTISQELALAHPERVRSLTLCVTWGGNGPAGEWLSRVWAPQVARSSREEHVDNLMLRCFSEAFFENERGVRFMRNIMLSNPHPQDPEGFIRQLEACGRHEARDRLAQLDLPVHVITAEHDTLVPPWKGAELAELIPGARHTVLERAAHMANLEFSDAFNEALIGFLDEQSGG